MKQIGCTLLDTVCAFREMGLNRSELPSKLRLCAIKYSRELDSRSLTRIRSRYSNPFSNFFHWNATKTLSSYWNRKRVIITIVETLSGAEFTIAVIRGHI